MTTKEETIARTVQRAKALEAFDDLLQRIDAARLRLTGLGYNFAKVSIGINAVDVAVLIADDDGACQFDWNPTFRNFTSVYRGCIGNAGFNLAEAVRH